VRWPSLRVRTALPRPVNVRANNLRPLSRQATGLAIHSGQECRVVVFVAIPALDLEQPFRQAMLSRNSRAPRLDGSLSGTPGLRGQIRCRARSCAKTRPEDFGTPGWPSQGRGRPQAPRVSIGARAFVMRTPSMRSRHRIAWLAVRARSSGPGLLRRPVEDGTRRDSLLRPVSQPTASKNPSGAPSILFSGGSLTPNRRRCARSRGRWKRRRAEFAMQ
jgi:hypothetical protein